MRRTVLIYLKDILENMDKAQRFVEGMSYERFAGDEKTCYAVQRCVEIIGEAAKQVPEEIRERYREIPWREMAGMRDKVVHHYFAVDPEKLWMAIQRDVPVLKPLVTKVLRELGND